MNIAGSKAGVLAAISRPEEEGRDHTGELIRVEISGLLLLFDVVVFLIRDSHCCSWDVIIVILCRMRVRYCKGLKMIVRFAYEF